MIRWEVIVDSLALFLQNALSSLKNTHSCDVGPFVGMMIKMSFQLPFLMLLSEIGGSS